MRALIAIVFVLLIVVPVGAQTDTNTVVFKYKIGYRRDSISKNDFVRIHTTKGLLIKGRFSKFKNGKIYTKNDTIEIKKIEVIAVKSNRRQKIGTAYMAAGISGILNVAGFNAAFSSADTLTQNETQNLELGYTSGYTLMTGVLISGVVIYNTYKRYAIAGREKSWEIITD
ncbi:MAG: hypothetical protein ACPGLV_04245 [Bacteroidia bacterium]